jgi:hypothetical protein
MQVPEGKVRGQSAVAAVQVADRFLAVNVIDTLGIGVGEGHRIEVLPIAGIIAAFPGCAASLTLLRVR